MIRLRSCVGEQDAVPHGEQPRRRSGIVIGMGRAGHVEQLLLVGAFDRDEVVGQGGPRRPRHPLRQDRELREVANRRRAESLEIAPDQVLYGCLGVRRRSAGRDERRSLPERPRRPHRGVPQGRQRAQRPPHPRLVTSEPLGEQLFELLDGARLRRVLEHVGENRVDVRSGQTGGREPLVEEPRSAQRRCHRRVEVRVVRREHGMQGDPHRGRLDDLPVIERGVEVGRIEVGHPVPQRDIRRRGLLRLQRHDAAVPPRRHRGAHGATTAAATAWCG